MGRQKDFLLSALYANAWLRAPRVLAVKSGKGLTQVKSLRGQVVQIMAIE